MTTATMERKNNFLPLLILVAIAAGLLYFSLQHAIEGHGVDAVLAYKCSLGSDNLTQRWERSYDGRRAWVCETPKGWAVVIEEADGDLVTAFIKEKMKNIESVMRYLKNGGYQQIW